MSSSAMMWASTHNDTLYEKMSAVVDVLDACQKKMGTGYLSAFPPSFFDLFEAVKYVWAPYYTIHKIMAGLLDQYSLAGNNKALPMVVWMAEYFGNRVKNVILKYTIERHWLSLNEETGGMNDVLYRLYSITNDQKHLILAHLFDKPCFLGLLALQDDSLSGFHANTHIPVVIGAQMRYEITGDALYKEIGTFFMDIVNSSHSYATGGTSVSEFWSNPKRLADTLSRENEESCTTYNMLKVSRNLFRWTKEMIYADYYERALMNGVLSIQRGREPGVMIYMLPQGPGMSKARSYHGWGTKFDSFWCCYGTGIESFSKIGNSIYFEEKGSTPGLYIIQYIPSSFNWKSRGIALHQKINPVSSQDPYLNVTLTVSANEILCIFLLGLSRLKARKSLTFEGNFFGVTRKWASNDNLGLQFPVTLRTEAIKDDRPEYGSIQAILFGPYLLAGLTDGDWDIKTGNSTSFSDWIPAVPASYTSQLTSLTQQFNNMTMVISNSNGSLTMVDWPADGTDGAVHATFRIFAPNSKSSSVSARKMVAGSSVMLEPFDLPGMVVQQGPNNGLIISGATGSGSIFRLVAGLDGNPHTVSLESVSQQGCFVSSGGASTSTRSIQLICQGLSVSDDISFRQAASFAPVSGLRQYHPVSFVAKGARRNFLLEPLLNLRDEAYTIYFNITA
ncbi:hypothetical protein COCNU_11G010660 [Cocos nucifera]|uniref:Non-reducing end beta-L-arabinofuranosidase-like GH127 catalytic domain-containing protein n=1 Tax=Cocos nucifera TaxID=13894 RepID=A0A8K0IPZ9_COCNU|nr:hypothetical protein COCNU_11G010660 [Cocos nucifera]